MNGAECLCRVLADLGVRHVFGLPGTQNVWIYEALRSSGLRSIVAADEGGAAFMAAGYARATGDVGVLTTIPGPGFMFALPGIVEAQHDSVPLLWITLRQQDTGRAYQLQRIDQAAIARPVVKHCIHVARAEDLGASLQEAHVVALSGEPGPVLVEIAAGLMSTDCPVARGMPQAPRPHSRASELAHLLAASERPVLIAGQGAQAAADDVRALAARLTAPVLFTSSGRGVLPDTDPLAFVQDLSTGPGRIVPEVLKQADLIVALGCKFTHNGSGGGQLDLPTERLVRIDTSAEVLAANYPARLAIEARVEDVLAGLPLDGMHSSRWTDAELAALRGQLAADNAEPIADEPRLRGVETGSIRSFFESLADVAGARAVYVTDAGLHQALTRRYAVVRRPRGLLCPSDFQSMGFGLPAAIGAAIARPDACVVACLGDAGLALAAGELLTAVREGVDLAVVVFNDGQMNLIRRQQVTTFGYAAGVDVADVDYAALAAAVGCSYVPVEGDLADVAAHVVGTRGVRLVELRLHDRSSLHWRQARTIVRERIRRLAPDSFWAALRRALGR